MGETIFVVHGHNQAVRDAVSDFLGRKLKQDLVILDEQPNKGQTIIEKFEAHAKHGSIGYAVVLLTADDVGGAQAAPEDKHELRPRAWQNAIFELGYFIGLLGRDRVCALYDKAVELPSDYSGVLYTSLDDASAWRLQLAKVIKEAGLPIDMNDAV